MLDLKAQLAAAGIVTAEQVKAFDEKEAKAKEAREAEAQRRKAGKSGSNRGKGGARDGNAKHNQSKGRGKGGSKGGKGRTSVNDLKAMGRGEAYDRMRKIVAHSRLDDKERTIPLPDDQTFNFVTATGSIGRLYLTAATVASLRSGESAISSFMSNHGLSHCVLPKEIALEFAEVFPMWLRHLRGHEPLVEVPEPPAEARESTAEKETSGNEESGSAESIAADAEQDERVEANEPT